MAIGLVEGDGDRVCGLLAPGSAWAAGPATIPGSTWGGAPATFDVA